LLPLTVAGIKAKNTDGTWHGDTYTENGVTFTIQKDSDGKVTGITANGTASDETYFNLADNDKLKVLAEKNIVLNGSIGGATGTYLIQAVAYNGVNSVASRDGDSVAFTPTSAFSQVRIIIIDGATVDNVNFYPMIRLASVSDTTFTPYIPSVDARLDAVESGLTNVLTDISANTHLNKDSNLDTLPLGWYGINLYEGSGTGTGTPSYNTVGILWHVKGASNSFIQYIFGYNYFACRIRSNTTDAWDAWKFGHNALPT
jgi:hypothetical protein